MLLDEPLSDIDVTTKENLLPEFRDVIHFMGIPAMYVTHDPVEAAEIGDAFAIMQEGVVCAMDSAEAAFRHVRCNHPSGYREEPLQAAARSAS
jgi:ABC-type molybdate transport system ATPase subunit